MRDRGTPLARRSIWIAQGIAIAGLLVYVLVVRLLAPALLTGGRAASVGVGVVLAIVPALLWLLLFYVQDAKEPEPLGFVLRVAMAGGIIAGAVALPILTRVPTRAWLGAGAVTGLIVSVLAVGSVQEFCKYLAVRFTVYDEDEFDEVADGVTYGTAAGVGLATVLNLWWVLNSPSIAPVPAALWIVVTTLAQAAFGGVLGFFLGRAKILGEHSRVLWGFLIATLLNGVVTFVLREVSRSGLTYRPWNGLVVAAVVATAVTLILFRAERQRAVGLAA
jgi:RsiW-degrading membrane proteinase PrsW (M82 family)